MNDAKPARTPFHVLCKPIGPKCNLRCEYCFYLKKEELYPDKASLKDFRMSDDTLESFVKQYIAAQHPSAPEVNFAWQGGEPTLLGIDFFRKAVEYQQKYKRSGMRISNAFQTNGVLLDDEWGKFLHENDFLVGISVDGPKQIHDHFRKDWGGNGTFDRVMRGLEALQRNNVEYNTLTVVQSHNGNFPRDVYRFLREIGSTFFQFIPIVEPGENGGVSERTVAPEQWGDFLCGVLDEWLKNDIGRIYVQHFEMMLSLHMGYPATLCVHGETCGRSVAIEHSGDLYSCDHFVKPENLLGNIHDKPMDALVDGPLQTEFGREKYTRLPAHCRRCKHLRFCYGGCPSDRVKSTPDGEPGLNYVCEGYYKFYDYSAKYFQAMAECLRHQMPPREYRRFMSPGSGASPTLAAPQMLARTNAKVGRNDPCPCGSGKKYKRCCGKR